MRLLQRIFIVTVVLLAVVGCIGYLVVSNIDVVVARYRDPIERWVGERLGGQIGASKIGVRLLPRPRIDLEGVNLRFGRDEPVFKAARIGVDLELMPLLWRSLTLHSVVIDQPVVRLERGEEGLRLEGYTPRQTEVAGGGGLFVGLDRFEVRGGAISLLDTRTGKTADVEGIELAGALRLEDGELRVAPLTVRSAKTARLGDFSGEFAELRSSLRGARLSVSLREGGFGTVRFFGDGEWRLTDGSARITVNGAKTELGDLIRLIEAVSGRAPTAGLDARFTGTAQPKLTIETGPGDIYRVNGLVELEGGTLGYRDLEVGEIRGVAQLALTESHGKIALDSFRGAIGATRAAVSLEGAIDLVPLGGELRIVAAALPLQEVKRFLPESENTGVVIASGAVGGKITYRFGVKPRWTIVADLREATGTVRTVPFQDGVGKVRVTGGEGDLEVVLEQLTLGLEGGSGAIVLTGELTGGRGSGSLFSSKLGLPTAVALSGMELPGWRELAGEVRLDLKGRYVDGVVTVEGPLGLTGGAGLRDGYTVSGATGEFELQVGAERKVRARELRFELNGEPLVWQGSLVQREDGIRFERSTVSGFGGDLTFEGSVSSQEPRRFEITGRGRRVFIEPVGKLLWPETENGVLTGELSDVRWRLAGIGGENFAQTLTGGVAFQLERGALRGVNIGRVAIEKIGSIPLLRNLLVGAIPEEYRPYFDAPDTPIHTLAGEIDLAAGRASTSVLRLESDLFGLDARGYYDLGGRVDLGATLSLERRFALSLADRVRELRGFFGPEGTIVVPLRITGSPTELSVNPDVGALIAQAARGTIEREAGRFIDRTFDRLTGGPLTGGPLTGRESIEGR